MAVCMLVMLVMFMSMMIWEKQVPNIIMNTIGESSNRVVVLDVHLCRRLTMQFFFLLWFVIVVVMIVMMLVMVMRFVVLFMTVTLVAMVG